MFVSSPQLPWSVNGIERGGMNPKVHVPYYFPQARVRTHGKTQRNASIVAIVDEALSREN